MLHFQDIVLLVGLAGTLIGSGIAWGRVLMVVKDLQEDQMKLEKEMERCKVLLRNGGSGVLDRLIRIEEDLKHAPCHKKDFQCLTEDRVRAVVYDVVVKYNKRGSEDDHR